MAKLALIAGTGFYDLPNLTDRNERLVDTKYGQAKVIEGRLGDIELVFLTRHGSGHTIPPHMINYRANIKALQDLGVSSVIAVNVVGGVDSTLKPGDLTLIDDFIDYTSGRINTFFDGGDEFGVQHIDMTNVYDKKIQAALLASATSLGISLRTGAVYAGFNGPRFETPAEIRMVAQAGGTVVGMTGCPEAALAREIALPYAAIALIVNPAAGLSEEEITMEEINRALDAGRNKVLAILADAVSRIAKASE
jgi:5'-deoxy-5'-methylthioadenosine phosphorylase